MEVVKVLRHFRLDTDGYSVGNGTDSRIPDGKVKSIVELPSIYFDVEKNELLPVWWTAG